MAAGVALMVEDNPLLLVAMLASVVGFVVGLGAKSLLIRKPDEKHVEKVASPSTGTNGDLERERFFKFTWIALDVLPHFLRLYFKMQWDSKYDSVLPSWSDQPDDGARFWNGVYSDVPVGKVELRAGEFVVTADNSLVDWSQSAAPRSKLKIADSEFKLLHSQTKGKASRLHLSQQAKVTGSFDAYNQIVAYESNCDRRMEKQFKAKALSGKRETWDTSLCCFALLQSSHQLLTEADSSSRAHVESVRSLRNDKIAHVLSCRISELELTEAMAIMDQFIVFCLPPVVCAEWCVMSRRVLGTIPWALPCAMPAAGREETADDTCDTTQLQLCQQQQQQQYCQQQLCQASDDSDRLCIEANPQTQQQQQQQLSQQSQCTQSGMTDWDQPAASQCQLPRTAAQIYATTSGKQLSRVAPPRRSQLSRSPSQEIIQPQQPLPPAIPSQQHEQLQIASGVVQTQNSSTQSVQSSAPHEHFDQLAKENINENVQQQQQLCSSYCFEIDQLQQLDQLDTSQNGASISRTEQNQAAEQAQRRAPAADVLHFPEYVAPADSSQQQYQAVLRQRWQREIKLVSNTNNDPHVIDISAFKALDSDGC
jgi:hypothetical protein